MATWEQVQRNPTLFPQALLPGEGERLHWHRHAHLPHSSQVYCVSALGMLRQLSVRDRVIGQLISQPFAPNDDSNWHIELEAICPELLSEYGRVQPSSVDALLRNQRSVVCLEAKFLKDAEAGFGGCSQPNRDGAGDIRCAGYYAPGSDLKTKTGAWCRLEVWDGERSPRTYWTLGRAFFRESVFIKQVDGETCPFNGPNYQLMRNFLYAAALAQRQKVPSFGVVALAPARKSSKLEQQIESFRDTVLQTQFGSCVQFVPYERLIELLRESGDGIAASLATFLEGRIAELIS